MDVRVNEFNELAECQWPHVYTLPVFEVSAVLVYHADYDSVRGPACADRIDIRGHVPKNNPSDFHFIQRGHWQEFTSEVLRADVAPFLEVCLREVFRECAIVDPRPEFFDSPVGQQSLGPLPALLSFDATDDFLKCVFLRPVGLWPE